eukprot:CAMPEP_0174950210 /NCGR_PEP_ID=MMETSP1355-20121228/93504_1 /TAXON_ID=464990 /ORGANISM="Hemiselmis tepida, Strain CCMP443" /LENGTH=53 /DNA_ID=CAMNT_0016197805 /DNA_START=54 /DNA_END=212 /DNA_ORIENTATION=-
MGAAASRSRAGTPVPGSVPGSARSSQLPSPLPGQGVKVSGKAAGSSSQLVPVG